jgi:NADPH-dependent F420 reductase
MRIAIIGAGNVGGTLGTRWAQKGHQVLFAVRNPADEKVKALVAKAPGTRAASVADATAASEVVTLSVPWEAAEEAIRSAGDLSGKIVVDATNPLAAGDGLAKGLLIGHTTSGAEAVAKWASGARVVKAFNTTGWPNMADPSYGSAKAVMLVCGDDESAKLTVMELAKDLGFEAADAGGLGIARLLEPMAMLWIHLAVFRGWGVNFAYGILRR